MQFKPLFFGILVAGSILCFGFFFRMRRSRIRQRLQLEAMPRAKEEKALDLEFLPKEVVDKVEDKLGLKKGSPKINELKKTLIQAGIYQESAPAVYFGMKLGLTVALPIMGMPWLFGRDLPLV